MTIFVLFLESMSSTLHPIILHVRTRSYKKKIFFQIFRSKNFAIFFHSFFSFFLVVLKEFKSMGKFSCSYRGIFFFMSEERECKEMGKEGKKIIAMYNFFYSSFISSYSLNANVLVPCIKITRRHGQNFLIELCYHCQYAYRHAHITHCHEKTWSVQFSDHLRFKLNKEWSCGWNEKEKKITNFLVS